MDSHITYDVITGITFVVMLWMLWKRHKKIRLLNSKNIRNDKFTTKLSYLLLNTEINEKTSKELIISKIVKLIEEHNSISSECFGGLKTNIIHHNKQMIVTMSSGDKNDFIKLYNNEVNKDIVWISGSMKFMCRDGSEFVLDSDHRYLQIKSTDDFIAKALEDDTHLITIIKP